MTITIILSIYSFLATVSTLLCLVMLLAYRCKVEGLMLKVDRAIGMKKLQELRDELTKLRGKK
jgi:hypothetical protein